MPKVDTMSTVKNQICKVIPQLSPSKSLLKKAKEKAANEQSSKAKVKIAKGQKGKPEKTVKLDKKSNAEHESLSFKDLNSHFSSVQFSTKAGQRSYRNGDAISGQVDSSISQLNLPDGNDLEERSFPTHFIGAGANFKNQISRPEEDDR